MFRNTGEELCLPLSIARAFIFIFNSYQRNQKSSLQLADKFRGMVTCW
jgi:hypothetical protein